MELNTIAQYRLNRRISNIKIGGGIALTVALAAATGGIVAPVVAAEVGALGVVAGVGAGAGAGGVLTGIGASVHGIYKRLTKATPTAEETQLENQEFDVISNQSVPHSPDTRSLASTVEDQEVEDGENIPLI